MIKKIFILSTIVSTLLLGNEKLEVYKQGSGNPKLMIIAGMHGNERSGILLLKENPQFNIEKGQIIIMPEVNIEASKLEKRKATDDVDLNRAFGSDKTSKTYVLADELEELIAKENPDLLLDLHESLNPNDGTDRRFYLGNSLIYTDKTFEKIMDLALVSDLSQIGSAPKGSLNRHMSTKYGIPVITVETVKTESIPQRQERYLKFINESLEFLNMK